MNILMLHNMDINEQGGVAAYINGLARQLVLSGNSVHIVYVTHNNELKDQEILDGLHLHRLYIPFRRGLIGYIYRYIRLNILISKLHKKLNFDLVCLHTPIMYSTLKHNKTFRKIPLVYTLHMPLYYELKYEFQKMVKILPLFEKCKAILRFPFYNYIYRKNEKGVLKDSRQIIVTTGYVKSLLEKAYGRKYFHKIKIAPPGIDVERFQQLIDKVDHTRIKQIRSLMQLPEKAIVFFILRRLSPRMGLVNLIKAVHIVKNRLRSIEDLLFLVGGKGILRERLETLIKELDLSENIRLLGFLSEKDKEKYFQISNCAIIPTEELEGFGIFTVEALACGLPVIGTSIGGTVEILSDIDNGSLLTDGTSPEAIADKIIYFLENRDHLSSAGEFSNFVKERYSWTKIAVVVEDAYRKAIF